MITATLTQEEVKARSFSLAQVSNQLVELEEEEDDVKADYKTKMADIKERRLKIRGELRRLSRAVRLGVEERTTQRVLFDEEKRQEEFRQQQQAESEEPGDWETEELKAPIVYGDEERERLHKEAVANWRREKSWEKGTFCACGHVHVALGCSEDDCPCLDFKEPEEEGEGFNPGFPPGFDPDRASAGLAQAGDYQVEWFAALTAEEREKYHAAPCACGHSRDWHGEEDKDICERGCGVCKCEQYHCPACDTQAGHRATCEHYVLGEGTPVQKADDFTAPICGECKRIDGGHTQECSKSNVLRFDDYLSYAEFTKPKAPKSWARKWELSKEMDGPVAAWKLYCEENRKNGIEPASHICKCGHARSDHRRGLRGVCDGFHGEEPCDCMKFIPSVSIEEKKPEPKKKSAKLSPVEAAIDR